MTTSNFWVKIVKGLSMTEGVIVMISITLGFEGN